MDELFPVWRYHPVFTYSPFTMLQAFRQGAALATRRRPGL